jgi:predicted nuclease of predicted toxin-antitoxin system
MALSMLRFLADMNISPETVKILTKNEWSIIRSSEILPRTAPDDEILEFAAKENRILITQDLDFSALVALSGHRQPSLITLRLSISSPNIVAERLLKALPSIEKELPEGCAVIIEDASLRIRKLPIE